MCLLKICAAVVMENLLFLSINLYPCPCQPVATCKEVTRVSETQAEDMTKWFTQNA